MLFGTYERGKRQPASSSRTLPITPQNHAHASLSLHRFFSNTLLSLLKWTGIDCPIAIREHQWARTNAPQALAITDDTDLDPDPRHAQRIPHHITTHTDQANTTSTDRPVGSIRMLFGRAVAARRRITSSTRALAAAALYTTLTAAASSAAAVLGPRTTPSPLVRGTCVACFACVRLRSNSNHVPLLSPWLDRHLCVLIAITNHTTKF